MSQVTAVRVEALWKRYGYRRALAGVDLELRRGSCCALLGPNGAGKSTLLKILATRARPSSGRVEILGLDARRRAIEIRRKIGVVFHEHGLRSDLTLDENLRFFGALHGIRDVESRSRERIERLGLSERRHDPVKTFSQGMLKRAALIRSLIHDPELWLLDEPFAGLDAGGQRTLSALIREESAGGRSVVFVSHGLEQALEIADDVVLIEDGELAARGLEDVRERLGPELIGKMGGDGG